MSKAPRTTTFIEKKQLEIAFNKVHQELLVSVAKFPPIHSYHEGYAVIKEELDELWAAIKTNDTQNASEEAVQVAAMAVRFLLDLYELKEKV